MVRAVRTQHLLTPTCGQVVSQGLTSPGASPTYPWAWRSHFSSGSSALSPALPLRPYPSCSFALTDPLDVHCSSAPAHLLPWPHALSLLILTRRQTLDLVLHSAHVEPSINGPCARTPLCLCWSAPQDCTHWWGHGLCWVKNLLNLTQILSK